ncbi:hypothetical protein NLU13_2161 [Sarocladium strictum]|uniref:C2H2-type domain-containing protein n=1 Tax=Sarocladium strictum TaxID=5046 RepID=A0AA39GT53_SARSR|nr:hypothetical protein NLU13_2161 [Sarocladium strictum]
MASAFTVSPNALHNHDHIPNHQDPSSSSSHLVPSTTSADPDLSPLLSQGDFSSPSPLINTFDTPGPSVTSPIPTDDDFGDLVHSDPFFGANFNNTDADGPSFLSEHADWRQESFESSHPSVRAPRHNDSTDSYPLTPEQTASIHTTTPRSELRPPDLQNGSSLPTSVSPQELQKPFQDHHSIIAQSSQLTPDQSSSCRSSEDGLAPAPVAMHPQSPRVLVSVWDRDNDSPTHAVERSFEDSPGTVRAGIESAGDLISSSGHRDSVSRWQYETGPHRVGLGPSQRSSDEITSINELMARRASEEKKGEVNKWLTDNLDEVSVPVEKSEEEIRAIDQPGRDSNDNIPMGDQTENKYVHDQTYYDPTGAHMSQVDYDIIAADRNWADAPMVHPIQRGSRHQPQSSQAAIEKWQNMTMDNMSIMSRAATWGTRRRSLPSVLDADIEGVTSGSFLKKLSLSKGSGDNKGSRPGGFLQELRGLVRRPSASSILKRSRSRSRSRSGSRSPQPESPAMEDAPARRGTGDSSPLLSLPTRSDSNGKKPTPSINTALVSITHNVASFGTTHTRKGSVSGVMTTSPKNMGSSLTVKNPLRRRSKSELPKPTAPPSIDTHQNLVGMWKASGGPPVAPIGHKGHPDADDDDDDDDDLLDDSEMKGEANLIDGTIPNFSGFQEHVLRLNPGLTGSRAYLVDRIAHQQIIRYKHLLNSAVAHLKQGAHCACGPLCKTLGGTAIVLDAKGEPRGLDPLASHLPDEEDTGLAEGAINQDSFPQDIPMPPTHYLPAEFECQLCYQRKKFQKPSDWTKHVHEDVQPFTCTWDKCRDAKIFKRKADWVRHENEGHRHLEWWTCDVEECRHTCYRRDNFLQHLVREHKFPEPKIKTKAAMKRAGGGDPTWQKVEQCHIETQKRPQEEPCRFCGKTFPTWKKLTVHLAKHMEQISLPVLRLVTAKAKEIDADTIISPVQDPPIRQMIPPMDHTPTGTPFPPSLPTHMPFGGPQMGYSDTGNMVYAISQQGYDNSPYLAGQPQFASQRGMDQSVLMGNNMHQPGGWQTGLSGTMGQQGRLQDLPVTSSPYVQGHNETAYMQMDNSAISANGLEPFPQLNALGLQNMGGPNGQMGLSMDYGGLIDPRSGHGSPFSGHGSVSPFQRSPHQGHGASERGWDDRQQSGFM